MRLAAIRESDVKACCTEFLTMVETLEHVVE